MVEPRRSEPEFSPSGWLVGALVGVFALVVAVVRTFFLSRGPLVLVALLLAAVLAILGGLLLLARRER
ncbi:MAG: hypothetical protein U5K28_02970 [Halobacteriales archaeon]|nr:hypothetical protein [Halobacteriales archaeon]